MLFGEPKPGRGGPAARRGAVHALPAPAAGPERRHGGCGVSTVWLEKRDPARNIGNQIYGAASTEHTLFDTGKLTEIVETLSEPNYRGFTYEGIGSILRIYEPGVFKFMCGMLGLIPAAIGCVGRSGSSAIGMSRSGQRGRELLDGGVAVFGHRLP